MTLTSPIRIAVDAMGGDHAPREVVRGAVQAAREYRCGILLVGKPGAIEDELAKCRAEQDLSGLDIEVVAASEVIDMGESPGTAIRKKRDASIIITAQCVKKGKAQGMVAAGSTGAAMAAALLHIGRIDGVDRPAIAVVMPSVGNRCLLIDAGANVDCIPEMLVQFARMGAVYMENVYKIPNPKVGLLNIGEESGKGNAFVNSAYKLLESDPTVNFSGNIEGRDIFFGTAAVAVCDGFTGNVALKSAEGVMRMFKAIMKKEMRKTILSKAAYLLAKPAFEAAGKEVDPEEFGGALLLGINGLCVISHGSSKARGIKNAIRVAKEAVENDVLGKTAQRIREGLTPV
ncbi:MAG: phosphate acyltransferase PlsX [Candidatus Melainabacteria bacterium]